MGKAVKLGLLGSLVLWTLLAAPPVHGQTSSQGSTIHTVAWGDTLFSIARQYDTTVDAVGKANSLADPTRIYAGQRLIIPTANVPTAPSEAGASHTVQAGENLYRIAHCEVAEDNRVVNQFEARNVNLDLGWQIAGQALNLDAVQALEQEGLTRLNDGRLAHQDYRHFCGELFGHDDFVQVHMQRSV